MECISDMLMQLLPRAARTGAGMKTFRVKIEVKTEKIDKIQTLRQSYGF